MVGFTEPDGDIRTGDNVTFPGSSRRRWGRGYLNPVIIQWARHVVRMMEDRSAQCFMEGHPYGTQPHGQPRNRWRDNIEQDVRAPNVNYHQWKKYAIDKRWGEILWSIEPGRKVPSLYAPPCSLTDTDPFAGNPSTCLLT